MDSEPNEEVDNLYYCPAIVRTLLDKYMSIYPLWSGLMLGNLSRHAPHPNNPGTKEKETRDTNCHVEAWFGIVKNHILLKKKRMRPGAFLRKMHTSLHGRYVEHRLGNELPDQLISIKGKINDISLSEETWAKKNQT